MKKLKKDNIVNFPSSLSDGEKEVEAILFAAAEPLDIDTIESKVAKKVNVLNILNKLQNIYKNRGINLVCISKKWSFRTSESLSGLMSEQKTVEKKLSKAAIETLSIIVYHQPVTRAEIELKNLLDRHRSRDGCFDCLVPVSGGKDGSYVAYNLKKRSCKKCI